MGPQKTKSVNSEILGAGTAQRNFPFKQIYGTYRIVEKSDARRCEIKHWVARSNRGTKRTKPILFRMGFVLI